MSPLARVERRRQFCARCGQLMFEFFRSSDGHFGVVSPPEGGHGAAQRDEVCCQTCGARYRWLERLSATGQPVARK